MSIVLTYLSEASERSKYRIQKQQMNSNLFEHRQNSPVKARLQDLFYGFLIMRYDLSPILALCSSNRGSRESTLSSAIPNGIQVYSMAA